MPPIIFEDNDILVIDKPSGLLVHGDGHHCEETLADFLIDTGKVGKEVGEPLRIPLGKGVIADCVLSSHEYSADTLTVYRPGIVHRLDKDTSGVMVIAKHLQSYLALKKQFMDREVKKEYLAVVRGSFKENLGSISVPIGRSKNDFRKWLSGRGTRGEVRDAVTDYRVLDRTRDEHGTEWSLIRVMPRTGRTHQIRVHMKYANHPLGGDRLYGDTKTIAAFPRLMLHAEKLAFTDLSGAKKTFEAEAPELFTLS